MTSNTPSKGKEPQPTKSLEDAFLLTDLYPDARALFEHEQASLSRVSENCMVVLDANVLLFPFEFSSASVKEVEKVYTNLSNSKRLVVPAQAAREFYKHRSQKIAAIADVIEGAIERAKRQILDKPIPLLEGDNDYNVAKDIHKNIINQGKELIAKLSAINERLKDEVGADRISVLYRTLLSSCISELDLHESDRKEITEEVARRARLGIAPGYKDKDKDDGGLGDYLIWRTILKEASVRRVHCMFVTEEEKSDWWVKRKGTFQPRPELIDEYRRASGGQSLHLVPLSGLLAAFKAQQEVVQQVQDLEEQKRHTMLEERRRRRVEARREINNNLELRRLENRIQRLRSQLEGIDRDRINLLDYYSSGPHMSEGTARHLEDLDGRRRGVAVQLEMAEKKLKRYLAGKSASSDYSSTLFFDGLLRSRDDTGGSSLNGDDDDDDV